MILRVLSFFVIIALDWIIVCSSSLMLFPYLYRAESAHSKLKRHLESCQGNFYHNWEKIHAMVEGQRTEILGSFERSLGCVQHTFGMPIFKELRGFVSMKALEHVLDEAKNCEIHSSSNTSMHLFY